MSGIIKSLLVPHYGWMTGADWDWGWDPGRPQDLRSQMFGNKLQYAGRDHDFSFYEKSLPGTYNDGLHHGRWIYDAWSGQGYEPGVFGQVIRLAGTPSFAIARALKL